MSVHLLSLSHTLAHTYMKNVIEAKQSRMCTEGCLLICLTLSMWCLCHFFSCFLKIMCVLYFLSGRAVGCEAAETEAEIGQWHWDPTLLRSFRAASRDRQFRKKAERKCSRMSQVWCVISEYCNQTSLINFVLIHRPVVLSCLLVLIKRLYNV
jgi:hypothetical protein